MSATTNATANATEEICCAICLDAVDISMNVIKTECKHCFHSNCFLQNAAHNGFSCPMCRNELASVPTDDEDDDENSMYSGDDDDEEVGEDFALRGARWLMMRAEGEEIEEDDTDDESTGSSDYDEEFVRYGNDENTNPTIAEISQQLIARGITYEQIVALYILPHHANAADVQTYSRTVIRNLENQVYDVLSVPPAN
jgi:hypothetical protein